MQLDIEGTKDDAEKVVEAMKDIRTKNGGVALAEVYELVGIPPKYSDELLGWIDLIDISIEKIEDFTRINLPDPIRITRH